MSAKLDDLGVFRSSQFKWVAITKPVIRCFDLITVTNLLLEHTIMITDTTAICCIAKCCQRVKEAGCQSAQTTIAKRCIRLLIFNYIDIQSQLFKSL